MLPNGLVWDTSHLYTTGELNVVAGGSGASEGVPEPDGLLLFVAGTSLLFMFSRRVKRIRAVWHCCRRFFVDRNRTNADRGPRHHGHRQRHERHGRHSGVDGNPSGTIGGNGGSGTNATATAAAPADTSNTATATGGAGGAGGKGGNGTSGSGGLRRKRRQLRQRYSDGHDDRQRLIHFRQRHGHRRWRRRRQDWAAAQHSPAVRLAGAVCLRLAELPRPARPSPTIRLTAFVTVQASATGGIGGAGGGGGQGPNFTVGIRNGWRRWRQPHRSAPYPARPLLVARSSCLATLLGGGGGAGGYSNGNGGDGSAASLVNAVTGSTTGSLSLTQDVTGGQGGATSNGAARHSWYGRVEHDT